MLASRMKPTDATSLPISSNSQKSSSSVKPTEISRPKIRSVADCYKARLAGRSLLPLTKRDKVDKTLQGHFRFLLIRVSTVDLGLSPHNRPQHIRESGAHRSGWDFHLAHKRFRNEDLGGVEFTNIGFPQIADVPMRH